MPIESFYEDVVIDTSEATANFEALFEEDPVMITDESINIVYADRETIDRFVKTHLKRA